MTLDDACEAVNAVCKDPASAAGLAQSEGELFASTLRKHTNRYMGGANWRDLNPEEHTELLRQVIRTQFPYLEGTIYRLVDLVCARISNNQPAGANLPAPAFDEPAQPMEPAGLLMEEGNDELLLAANDHLLEFSDSECFLPHEAEAPWTAGNIDNGFLLDEATSRDAEALLHSDSVLEDIVLEELDLPGLPLLDDLELDAILATFPVGGGGGGTVVGVAMGTGLGPWSDDALLALDE